MYARQAPRADPGCTTAQPADDVITAIIATKRVGAEMAAANNRPHNSIAFTCSGHRLVDTRHTATRCRLTKVSSSARRAHLRPSRWLY